MKIVMDIWIDGGNPQLALIDRDTGHIMHQWRLEKTTPQRTTPLPQKCITCKSLVTMQQLIKQLFLLACHNTISQAPSDHACVHSGCNRSRLGSVFSPGAITDCAKNIQLEG
ncbi:MAG: hypothetical protein AB1810_04435 [Pseudomonadota bacterium]